MGLSRGAIWGVVLLNLHTAARTVYDTTHVSRQLVTSTPVPDHDFDFRGWGGEKFDLAQSQFTSDLFKKSLVAVATK